MFSYGMNITLKSKVENSLENVHNGFDGELFKYLLPPGAKLIAFGGSTKGDIVHLNLPIAGEWISEITEHGETENTRYFIDEGIKLPFHLKTWKHKHLLHREGNTTVIEDNMTFSTGNFIMDCLFYPVLLLSFLPRVWQYKSYFKQ